MSPKFLKPSKRYADIITRHDGHNQIAIDMVRARLEAMLAGGAR